jgi:hypothetical protein
MKDLKRTLKIAGILSLVTSLLGIASLLADIYFYPFDPYAISMDMIEVVLSIATGVIYLVYMRKSENEIVSHRGLFLTLNILNIFNNLIVWAVSFWVDISVNNAFKKQEFNNFTNQAFRGRNFQDYQNNQGGQYSQGSQSSQGESQQSSEFIVSENDYSVKKDNQTLQEKLEEINKLKENNMISEEEYYNLRKKIFDDYTK